MLYSQKSTPVVLSFFAALGLASSAMADQTPAITAAPKLNIGVVDKDKVVTGYPQAQRAAEDLKRSEDRVHKLIEDSNKQYEEAKASKKPQAELESLQKRLQTSIDKEVKEIQTKAQGLETQLENDIDGAIKAEAASRKCDAVFVKQAVLVGGTDITDGVVKRLGVAKAAAAK